MPTGETYYGTGHRKTAVARVWLVAGGSGKFTVNYKTLPEYCTVSTYHHELIGPFAVTGTIDRKSVV